MSPKVLVADDDPQMIRALRTGLEANGYEVIVAKDGEEALRASATAAPDIVVLDLVMPRMDGLEFCRRFRTWSQTPIIVLSVQGQEQQKIAALDLGADDYLTKPFGLGELLARLRALLRRSQTDDSAGPARYEVGDLAIDLGARLVTRDGKVIHLTPTEFDLLAYLVRHEGRVLTHRLLLTNVWGLGYADQTPSLRVMITQLRKKIEVDPARPRLIATEPGVGYRFQSQP
jgi:two-component system, OmpR family, KDP operon response regulator KdpE